MPLTTSFSLLPNKQKRTYESALQQIKETCLREGFYLSLEVVHVDCEVGLYDSVRKVFSGIKVRLCYFHISDAIRKNKARLGLVPLGKKNKSLKTWMCSLSQMFWFPPQLIPNTWAAMWDQLDADMKTNEKVLGMRQYMQNTWIPTAFPICKKSTKFDVLTTNLFDIEDSETNNNTMESYNARLKTRFGTHPNIFRLSTCKCKVMFAMSFYMRSCISTGFNPNLHGGGGGGGQIPFTATKVKELSS